MEISMKRKCLAVGIILLFVGTCIIPATAQETEKSQSTLRGNWLYVGGSGPGNYTRIQDAINTSSDGDTIVVYNKTYYEHILVDKQLVLLGIPSVSGDVPLIDGGDLITVSIQADNCSLERFRIQSHRDFGIHIESNGNIIRNCSVLLAVSDLKLKNSDYNLITENIFRGNGQGILLQNSSYNIIRNNLVDQHHFHTLCLWQGSSYNLVCNNDLSNSVYWEGICNEDNCSYNTYLNNTIRNNRDVGIHIKNSGLGLNIVNNCLIDNGISFESSIPDLLSYTIENNTLNGKQLYYLKNQNNMDISDAGQVILIQCRNCRILNQTISKVRTEFSGIGGGICLVNSSSITISGNTISGCTPVGIDVISSTNVEISSNVLSENYGGISLKYSKGNNIVDNVIQNGADEGVEFYHSSENTLKRNTISGFTYALYLWFSSSNMVLSNQLLNHTKLFLDSISNTFISNTLKGGITLGGPNTLMYNNITQGEYGIILDSGAFIRIIRNNIMNNKIGLQADLTSFSLMKKNNFLNNTRQASFKDTRFTSLFPDIWIQNYWDDFNGSGRYPIEGKYIINHFSFDPDVSIPPTIYPWTKYDWFPAKEPYDIPTVI
jgi:nitrous oxidase accessory protein